MASTQTYLDDPLIRNYIKYLRADSLESAVNNAWDQIVSLYFDRPREFTIDREASPLPAKSKKRADITIKLWVNKVQEFKQVLLIEGKRVSSESLSSDWEEAVEQLTSYLKLVRVDNYKKVRSSAQDLLFGIVVVGRYARFYVLRPGKQKMEDYPGTNGVPFEMTRDASEIHNYLVRIRDIIKRRP